MYICSCCGKSFEEEDVLVKHYLKCWRDLHPIHQSKPAPRSEDINTRVINEDMLEFFEGWK